MAIVSQETAGAALAPFYVTFRSSPRQDHSFVETPGTDAQALLASWLSAGLLGIATASSASGIRVMSHISTSPVLLDLREAFAAVVCQPPDPAAMPFSERALLVCSSLGISKSELARIFGVSRPALYAWVSGESEPQGANAQRLRILGLLVTEVCRETRRPLFHRFVNEPLPGETESIVDVLLSDAWDEPRLRRLFAEARRLTTERDARIARAKLDLVSTADVQEKALHDNLVALGAEG